ncbi:hypothetical protein BDF14DRAFT_1336622 [Spinellus fusiger]|nr:hypothetical protein BDF14DRAFT_1336622 [Spinellus fusiger]
MSYPQPSPMSIHQLVHSAEDSHKNDRDVQLAAEALGTLASLDTGKRSFPSLVILPPLTQYASAPSTTPSSPLPTPGLTTARYSFSSESTDDDIRHIPQHHFIHRVSNIPLVHSALRAYESSKASSSVVKYGAEMVESLAAPIYDKFGRRVLSDAVDEWGCKQLDKCSQCVGLCFSL